MDDPRYQPPQQPFGHGPPNPYPHQQQQWNAFPQGYNPNDPAVIERKQRDHRNALWVIAIFVVGPFVLIMLAGIGIALWIMSSVPR